MSAPKRVQLTVPADRPRRLPGVEVHRSRRLGPAITRMGLPCTDPFRTFCDCGEVVLPAELDDLVDRALATRAITIANLGRALAADRSRRPGVARVRRSIEDRGITGGPTPSVLESRMARLLHRSGAPRLKAECKWGPDSKYRLDFADPERRLLIEVDGYAWHSTPDQMRRDLRRRNELNRAGWTILVYTWKDVTGEEERVIQEIADSYTKRAS